MYQIYQKYFVEFGMNIWPKVKRKTNCKNIKGYLITTIPQNIHSPPWKEYLPAPVQGDMFYHVVAIWHLSHLCLFLLMRSWKLKILHSVTLRQRGMQLSFSKLTCEKYCARLAKPKIIRSVCLPLHLFTQKVLNNENLRWRSVFWGFD